MSDVYLIKKETLTAIADAIRNNSPNTWEGQSLLPEEMPQCIADCYTDGYDDGYADGQASGGGSSEVIDLRGTTCHIPSGWTATAGYGTFNINGVCTYNYNGEYTINISRIKIGQAPYGKGANYVELLKANSNSVVYLQSTNEFTLAITDGDDVTNIDLFNWLDNNGEFTMSDEYASGYKDGYDDGVNSVLVNFADWTLSTTSSSCTLSIANTHPSLYLHLSFFVDLLVGQGESYADWVVVPPNSSYSWDSGDYWDSVSGAEWNIIVESMRFSEDGV